MRPISERDLAFQFIRKSPRAFLIVAGLAGRQRFDGNQTVEAGVVCLPYHSHASLPEFFEDLVVGDRLVAHFEYLMRILLGRANGPNGAIHYVPALFKTVVPVFRQLASLKMWKPSERPAT